MDGDNKYFHGLLPAIINQNQIDFILKKIKVLQIIADSSLSGAPMTLFNFAKAVDSDQFEITCACPPGPFAENLKQLNKIRLEVVPMASKWNFKTYGQIRRLVIKISPDIVDCHGVRAGLLGRIASIGLGRKIKVIYTEHLWTAEYRLKNPINHYLQLVMLRLLDRLTFRTFAVSKAVAEFLILKKITRKGKVVVVYSGLELPKINKHKKQIHSTKIIGFVGGLNLRKGVEFLLRAMPEIIEKTNFEKVKLVIVGDGIERKRLIELSRQLKISQFVEFKGFVKDTTDFYPTFDVYAQPSLDEAFGFATLEALSYGCPVVCSNVGGLPEVLGYGANNKTQQQYQKSDCGLLVKPRDPDGLAQAILKILTDDELMMRMSFAAIERAKEFELSKTTRSKEEAYRKIANTV